MKKQKSGLIGLYSGQQIKRANDNKITRTQTGDQAERAIVKKYGSIIDNAKYYHAGNGNWIRYTLENDRKRTGKTTTDIKKWRSKPHKLDYQGIDTKKHQVVNTKKPKQKRGFSVGSLKSPASPVPRSKKKILPLKIGVGFSWTEDGKAYKIRGINKLNDGTITEYEIVTDTGYKFKTSRDTLKYRLSKMNERINEAKKHTENLKFNAPDMPFEHEMTLENRGKVWVARITGLDPKYGLARDFIEHDRAYGRGKDLTYNITKSGYYEYQDRRTHGFFIMRNGIRREIDREDLVKHFKEKAKLPVMKIKAKYVYGSFPRPLWAGFNPGVPYRKIAVTNAHIDPRWNRKPHDVIVTEKPISEEKQKSLELTDLVQGKKMSKKIKYINSLNFLNDNMKGSLISQVKDGKPDSTIDKYIEKGRKQALKKKLKVSSLSQLGTLKPRTKTRPLKVPMKIAVKSIPKKLSRRKQSTEDKNKKKLADLNSKINALEKSISETPKGYTPISDIAALKRLKKSRDRLIGISTPTNTSANATSDLKKRVVAEAREDWNQQCKMFMTSNRPFRDKTSKECYLRHAKVAGIK